MSFWQSFKIDKIKKLISIKSSLPLLIGVGTSLFALEVVKLDIFLISLAYFLVLIFKYKMKYSLKFLIWPLAGFSIFMVIRHFGTILDIEAAINLLVLLHSLKLVESRNKRDYFVHAMIINFLIVGIVLFSQTIITTSIVTFLLTFNFINLYLIENKSLKLQPPRELFKLSIPYLFPSLVFVALIFIIFPRYEFGLFRFSERLGKSGFSPDVLPSTVDEVKLVEEKIFKVQFAGGSSPAPTSLYWIGSTLTRTDGFNWYSSRIHREKKDTPHPRIKKAKKIHYTITSESMVNQYLFSLSMPLARPLLKGPLEIKSPSLFTYALLRKNAKKIQYTGLSSMSATWSESKIQSDTQNQIDPSLTSYPGIINSKELRKLSNTLRGNNNEETVNNLIKYFANGGFSYTLKPGRVKSLKHFLFTSKKGFCMHYASAFALLARMQKIPARVISGFQGGRYNELGDFYTITGKDAHAWVQVHLKKVGWKRIDPVSVVAPLRTELGADEYFSLPEGVQSRLDLRRIGLFSRFTRELEQIFDYIDTRWSDFLISFDIDYQQKIGRLLSLNLQTLYKMAFLTPILFIVILFVLNLMKTKFSLEHTEIEKVYLDFIREIDKTNIITKEKSWPPKTFLEKIITSVASKNDLEICKDFLTRYQNVRYGSTNTVNKQLLNELKSLIKELKKRVK